MYYSPYLKGWYAGYNGFKPYCPYEEFSSFYYDYWDGFEDGEEDYSLDNYYLDNSINYTDSYY